MKILLVSMLFYPTNHIGAIRPTAFAKYLALRGHEVTVLASSTDKTELPGIQMNNIGMGPIVRTINQWLLSRHKQKHTAAYEIQNKTNVKARMHPLKIAGLLLLDHLRGSSWKRNCKRFVRKQGIAGYDVIISSYGPIGSYMTGHMLRKMNVATHWICDLRDRMPNARYPECFNKLYRKYERSALCKADAIILVSSGQRDLFIQDHKPENCDKLYMITDGYETISSQPAELRSDNILRLCYTGALYWGKRDMTMLLEALHDCINEKIVESQYVELHYAGHDGKILKEQATRIGLNVVIDHGFVPREQALDLQKSSDILISLTWNNPEDQGVLPGKFFEYMAFGKPVISIVTGNLANAEISSIVNGLRLGIACEQFNKLNDTLRLKEYIAMQYRYKRQYEPLLFEADSTEVKRYDYINLSRVLEDICFKVQTMKTVY